MSPPPPSMSDDETMEDVQLHSPPRSWRQSRNPGTRLLFDDERPAAAPLPPAKTPYRRPNSTRPSVNLNSSGNSQDSSGRKRSSVSSRTSDNGDEELYKSPHMSPATLLTMDGRFVTSKNPFSSPICDSMEVVSTNTAPSLPMNFYSSSNSVLPPRKSSSSLFTGSPVPEDATVHCGSLHKVRRLSKDHDVVSATTQHLNDRISPTDVVQFPRFMHKNNNNNNKPPPKKPRQPPPTPMKQRPSNFHFAARKEPSTSRFESDFDIIGELGNGVFGKVYKVLSRLDGCMYAIKTAHRRVQGTSDRDRMLKEVYALAALSDQADPANFHIVRYHQAWMEDSRLYIQTELCSCTLHDEMNRGPLTSPRKYKLLRELLLALEFIHRNQMVHLDIKPENIFLKNDQYKLGDFGLVIKLGAVSDIEEGDSRYMSMELLSGDRSDLTKSDIFSMGATMYEICLGRPLPANGQEWQDIRSGRFSALPSTDPDMKHILASLMNPIPALRPTAASLLKLPNLLSDEQKALQAEKNKYLLLTSQMAPKRPLTRANTWSGGSLVFPPK